MRQPGSPHSRSRSKAAGSRQVSSDLIPLPQGLVGARWSPSPSPAYTSPSPSRTPDGLLQGPVLPGRLGFLFRLGSDEQRQGLDQRQVREGLGKVAEVLARRGVDLLRVQQERPGE
jgi:hypothetical protein